MFQINMYTITEGKCIPTTLLNAKYYNEECKGDIYWTPNNFSDFGKRKKEDLVAITSLFLDMDQGTKEEQKKQISLGPDPSSVIETKRGFQPYFYLKNEIEVKGDPVKACDMFREFQLKRLVPFYNADPQACDACRMLRMPMYRYWKDGVGDFWVDIAYESNAFYTWEQLERYFPIAEDKIVAYKPRPDERPLISGQSDAFWARANQIDCRLGLERLSGTAWVAGEKFTIKNSPNGEARILIDGKKRNCWIDQKGDIGSTVGGGPKIPNWIHYYVRDWKKVAQILKEVFPEELGSF